MNALMRRYGMVADRSARAGAMDDVGGSAMGGGALGSEPILTGYQGGGQQMDPGQSYQRLMDTISKNAKSAADAEAMLSQFWENDPSDMNGEMIDKVAKDLGVNPPWAKRGPANPLMQR